MTFSDQLRFLVDKNGGPAKAAELCEVTRQSVNRWLRGEEPNKVTRAGIVALLEANLVEYQTTTDDRVKPTENCRSERAPIFGGMLKARKKGG